MSNMWQKYSLAAKPFWRVIVMVFLGLNSMSMNAFTEESDSFRYRKPGANIQLNYPKSLQLSKHQSHQVPISFVAPSEGIVTIALSASDGVLTDTEKRWRLDLSRQKAEIVVPLELQTDNLETVFFFIEMTHGGQTRSRVLGVAVESNKRKTKPKSRSQFPAKSAEQPKIISLPAQEKISPL